MKTIYDEDLYTSNLRVMVDDEDSFTISHTMDEILEEVKDKIYPLSPFNPVNVLENEDKVRARFEEIAQLEDIPLEILYDFSRYKSKRKLDPTGFLKGFAISIISRKLDSIASSYVVSFGNDLIGRNIPFARIYNKEFNTEESYLAVGDVTCFTSGNTKTRGNHIIQLPNSRKTKVVTVYSKEIKPITADILATSIMADKHYEVFDKSFTVYMYNSKGSLLNGKDLSIKELTEIRCTEV